MHFVNCGRDLWIGDTKPLNYIPFKTHSKLNEVSQLRIAYAYSAALSYGGAKQQGAYRGACLSLSSCIVAAIAVCIIYGSAYGLVF